MTIRPETHHADAANRDGLLPFGFDAEDGWLARVRQADQAEALEQWLDYQILSPGITGGQGVVYRCRRADGRIVAVKRIHGGAGAPSSARQRLKRELELAAALTHPHIVPARTVAAGEELLLESDWIDGQPLTTWCREDTVGRKSDPTSILTVFIAACDAVQYAHEQGVIHRDLKPSNLLVDGDGRPHVLDFGLAKTIAEFSVDASRTTLTEPVLGTPAYASPEQIAGGGNGVDARTDVYSLGVLLYEAFTGESPYPRNLSLGRLLRAVEDFEPPRPRCLDPSIGRNVEAVILRALKKDCGERYPTVAALRDDLQRCREGTRPAAPAPGLWFDLRAFARRNPTIAWLFLCAISVVTVAVLLMSFYALRLGKAHRETLAAHRAAERVNDLLGNLIFEAGSAKDDAEQRLLPVLDRTAKWLDAEFAAEPWALARAHVALGRLYAKGERWVDADRHLSRALDDYRRLGEADRPTVAEALRMLGLARAYRGADGAIDLQREALAMAQRIYPSGAKVLANYHAGLGESLLLAKGAHARAEAANCFDLALTLLRQGNEHYPAWEAAILTGYARALMHVGQFDAAVERLREASSLFDAAAMPPEACLAHRGCMSLLASVLDSQGNSEQASEIRRRLDAIRKVEP